MRCCSAHRSGNSSGRERTRSGAWVALVLLCLLGQPLAARAQVLPDPAVIVEAGDVATEPKESGPSDAMIEALLNAARVSKRDVVIVLGSGEGRIPIVAAAKFGARAIGIERDVHRVDASRKRALEASAGDRVTFRAGDPMQAAIDEATVLFALLAPVPLAQMRPRLQSLRPGTRMLGYEVGIEGWEPDATISLDDAPEDKDARGMLWIVPARVAGVWQLKLAEGRAPHDLMVSLRQRFQRVDGEVRAAGIKDESITNAVVRGDRLSFLLPGEAGERAFYAQVRGNTMTGVATDGVRSVRFRADRAAK